MVGPAEMGWVSPDGFFDRFGSRVFVCLTSIHYHHPHTAPSKTHILLLAPRSFSPPSPDPTDPSSSSSWLPRQTLSPRLSSILFAPPLPPPAQSSSTQPRPRAMIKKKPKGPEVEFIRVVRGPEGGVKVEDARGSDPSKGEAGEGDDGEGDLIWWMWEGGVVEGWREK